ncbi:MAG: phospholipase D family protein [Burkholderiaceae bacterium]|nr:phospholipase D family protein [Burkholderiaceae bacterium]
MRLLAFVLSFFLLLPAWAQKVDVAFSPSAGAEALVLKTIGSATKNIRMAAYSFTSPAVMKQLVAAKKRGVDVRIIVDEKGNTSKASVSAMNLVVNAGIPLRTTSKYKIHHDKYIVVDALHVETGSFNYSQSAAKNNSENVIVVWGSAEVAKRYLQHWQSRWDSGKDWVSSY